MVLAKPGSGELHTFITVLCCASGVVLFAKPDIWFWPIPSPIAFGVGAYCLLPVWLAPPLLAFSLSPTPYWAVSCVLDIRACVFVAKSRCCGIGLAKFFSTKDTVTVFMGARRHGE